jgi:hypothetical protein
VAIVGDQWREGVQRSSPARDRREREARASRVRAASRDQALKAQREAILWMRLLGTGSVRRSGERHGASTSKDTWWPDG